LQEGDEVGGGTLDGLRPFPDLRVVCNFDRSILKDALPPLEADLAVLFETVDQVGVDDFRGLGRELFLVDE